MRSAQTKQTVRTDVDQAIQQVRGFYEEGKAQLKLGKQYGADGTASEKERLAKAKAIANPITGYTLRELNQLFDACRRSQFVVTRAHVMKLVTVQKGPDRRKLQDQTIAEHWSTLQLGLTLRAQFGNRRPSAGRMRTMIDWNDAKSLILKFSEQWRRMHTAVTARCEQAREKGAADTFTANVSPTIEEQMLKVDRALNALKVILEPPSSRLPKSRSKRQ